METIALTRIVCPTDYSALSAHALRYARSIADRFNAAIHILHVVDEAYQYWGAMGPNSLPIGPPPEEMIAAAKQGMNHFVQTHLSSPPANVVTEVRLGRPFIDIIRYAREVDAGLIVMGTHGRSGLTHVLLGSVTEKVVRKSPCPVLIVRDPDQVFEMP